MYSRIQSSRLYEKIVEQIEELILADKLQKGDQLPSERELAEQFDVSRTAVREAIKTLREKGLVEIQSGRGTFIVRDENRSLRNSLGRVVKGHSSRLVDLVQVRDILEPEIAMIAASQATAEDIQKLQEAVRSMDQALEDQDADAFIETDLNFHLALAQATRNRLIPILLDPIVDLLREQRQRIFLVDGGAQRGQHHHKKILKAIADRDPEAARLAMKAHLDQVRYDSDAPST